MTETFCGADPTGRDTLVVMLHGLTGSPDRLRGLCQSARSVWPDARFLVPQLPLGAFSIARLESIVASVLLAIDGAVDDANEESAPFTNIVLVGHSIGGVLVRKVYVAACGETAEAPFEAAIAASGPSTEFGRLAPRPWARQVSRIVLLAGMNRGWRISHHLGIGKAIAWTIGSALELLPRLFGRSFAIFGIRRGARFITQLRVQWLRMRQARAGAGAGAGADWPGGALTVQLLGSRDDMVAPEDNIDLASGGDFVYLDVPYSGHADVVDFEDPTYGAGRRRTFLFALVAPEAELKDSTVQPSDEQLVQSDAQVLNLLFVIHGIRDMGYWTHKIARRVKQRAGTEKSRLWATETSSYGYFPMLPFLFPWTRREKVEWLMDQYTEALARYPQARFSYVGHSNGTYLLAKAIELYPCCQFENVTFAGSVVSKRYDWDRAMNSEPPQVRAVLNFTASNDWVVAWFPKFFQFLRLQDLGSAGHDGFEKAQETKRVHQRGFMKGGHGAALDEALWDGIADFTISGEPPPKILPGTLSRPRWWVRWPGYFPPLIWALIAVALVLGWQGVQQLVLLLPLADPTSCGFARGVAASLYLLALWKLVTRV